MTPTVSAQQEGEEIDCDSCHVSVGESNGQVCVTAVCDGEPTGGATSPGAGRSVPPTGSPGGVIPARDTFSPDLVHPDATGHALVADWVADELLRRLGARLRPPDLEAVWRSEKSSAPPLRAETWRRVMTVLYGSYLYG